MALFRHGIAVGLDLSSALVLPTDELFNINCNINIIMEVGEPGVKWDTMLSASQDLFIKSIMVCISKYLCNPVIDQY